MKTTREIAEKIAALHPWNFQRFNTTDFTYQTCRFCKRGRGDAEIGDGLWKYGVRHYVCRSCAKAIFADHGLYRSGLYGTERLARIDGKEWTP